MLDFSHLLHLYLGQILSWEVQKCGVSSTLTCHYDKGLSVDVRVVSWSGSYTLGDDYTKMKESGCHAIWKNSRCDQHSELFVSRAVGVSRCTCLSCDYRCTCQ